MVQQDGAFTDEPLPPGRKTGRDRTRGIGQFLRGMLASLLVNVLTIVAWLFLGAWPPAVVNVALALVILGVYGLENQWAFPLGYWTVELVAAFLWVAGINLLGLINLGG